MNFSGRILTAFALGFCMTAPQSGLALEQVRILVGSGDEALKADISGASQVAAAARADGTTDADALSAALADYRTLTEALYANGYYGGVVRISIDGREAATLNVLNPPRQIRRITIRVEPGRPFTFGRFSIAPAPPAPAEVPPLTPGARARSAEVRAATQATIDGWRDAGHAKARIAEQRYTADHASARLGGDVRIAPGPQVTFGELDLRGSSAVRPERIRAIAGLPGGEVFSPEALRKVGARLRRTGAFSSVAVQEAETLGPANAMDIEVTLADEKPRRFGFGAELSNLEGLRLSGFWLHRNLFGGAERLRIEGAVDNIGGQTSGTDYALSARLTRPATFGPDTSSYAQFELESLDQPTFASDTVTLGFGLERLISDRLEVKAGLSFLYAETEDAQGSRSFSLLNAPIEATWDRRNDELNPTDGFYVTAEFTPYLGMNGSDSGLRSFIDMRGYQKFGGSDRFVFAARAQLGSIAGSALTATYPDYLFYSGGGGSVRGQPYQSLDVDLGGGNTTGGRSFIGLSAELRIGVTDTIGAVIFADSGYIGSESFYDGTGQWHSGAGIGLRYATPFGPIRFDVATPVSGDTGDGVQFYLGIGQAF